MYVFFLRRIAKISDCNFHFSPYRVTVLVSCCPQHGKVTARADLIFEEYVGLDIHEKYVIMRNTISVASQANRKRVHSSGYSLAKEIYIIEDDTPFDSKGKTDIPVPASSAVNLSSMSSFDLLQEEDEAVVGCHPQEESEILNEETVFNHIRKKSKNLPVFVTSMDDSYDPLTGQRNPDLSEFQKKMKSIDSVLAQTSKLRSNEAYTTGSSATSSSVNKEMKDICHFSEGSSGNRQLVFPRKQQFANLEQIEDGSLHSSCGEPPLERKDKYNFSESPNRMPKLPYNGQCPYSNLKVTEYEKPSFDSFPQKAHNTVSWGSALSSVAVAVAPDDPADQQSHLLESQRKQEETFMGFKSVFSFLWD